MSNRYFPIIAGCGACFAIGVLAYLDALTHSGLWLMAPFGATTVLVFGVPKSQLAQPRNVIMGHVLSATIGVTFFTYVGVEPWSLAIATGFAVMLMIATNTTHPPAGADPILIMLLGKSWGFIITPVFAGAVTIVLIGIVVNKLKELSESTYTENSTS
ncbi:MAG: HPP family protein [Desulfovibrio sp.]